MSTQLLVMKMRVFLMRLVPQKKIVFTICFDGVYLPQMISTVTMRYLSLNILKGITGN